MNIKAMNIKTMFTKPMVFMLIGVSVLFGLIFAWKGIQAVMIKKFYASMQQHAATVSTTKVVTSDWQSTLQAVGSLRAKVGVNVTTELAGMVKAIHFTPGSEATQNQLLVELNADEELGKLHALQAQVELAKVTYQRDQAQFKVHAVSQQTVDGDAWNLKNLQGQVEEQAAIVAKKMIHAPFSGYLGIRNINLGQYLNVGDKITTLQALDPIYVDFYLPQQTLAELKTEQKVNISPNTFPHQNFQGSITTIEPIVDTETRNVQVEATLLNPNHLLKPGMFVHVTVETNQSQQFLTVPQSAISFNPYGDIAYVVKQTPPTLTVQQVFVTLGETRGDQIAVLKGLKAGDEIVTSGQLKLRNGSTIVINNTIQPSDNAAPQDIER
jgi:membrane fusion protein (multidrug efflux system)